MNRIYYQKNKFKNIFHTNTIQVTILLFLLVVLAFFTYSNTLNSPFILDDSAAIQKPSNIRLRNLNFQSVLQAAKGGKSYGNRPIANLSFALNYYFNQYRVGGYHIVNIFIHIITGILLFLLVKITLYLSENPIDLDEYRKDKSLSGSISQYPSAQAIETSFLIPFFTTIIWFTNPVQTQSVTYIVQRMNSMAAMFYILSLLLYIKGRIAQKNKTHKIVPVSIKPFKFSNLKYLLVSITKFPIDVQLYFTGSIFAGLLAIGSKENAAILPIFILIYEWFFFQSLSQSWLYKNSFRIVGTIFIFIILAFIFLNSDPIGWIDKKYASKDFTMGQRVLTESRVVIYYIGLMLFPHPSRLNLDYDFPVSNSLTDPITTLFSVVTIGLAIFLSIIISKKNRLFSFCIIWYFGNLIIESSIIGIEIIHEHRCYLPSMSIFLALSLLIFRNIKFKWFKIGILCLIIILFSKWTWDRNRTWQDEITIWSDSVAKSPQKARPHIGLGLALEKQGKINEAVSHLYEAVRLRPNHSHTRLNLGQALEKNNMPEEAIVHFTVALQLDPYFFEAHNNLGIALLHLGRVDEALEHFNIALKLNPNSANVLNNIGLIYARCGKIEKAIIYFQKAHEIAPHFTNAENNMLRTKMIFKEIQNAANELKKIVDYVSTKSIDKNEKCVLLLKNKNGFDMAIKNYKKALITQKGFTQDELDIMNIKFTQKLIEEYNKIILSLDCESRSGIIID